MSFLQAPPPEILPKKSNLVPGACQTYFTDISTGKGSFQVCKSTDAEFCDFDFNCLFVFNQNIALTTLPSTKNKKVVDINLQQRNLLGIQFVIWSGGSSWIKNNGTNFFVGVTPVISSGKVMCFILGIITPFSNSCQLTVLIAVVSHGGIGFLRAWIYAQADYASLLYFI